MLEAVWKHGVLFYAVGVMCVLGVISKITVSLTLRRLVKEAGKMGKSLHPLMKLVRAKFEHACMVSDKVQNIRAFVDKYMYEYKVLWIKLHSWRQMEKAAAWCCLVFGAAGAAAAYVGEAPLETVGQYAAAGLAGSLLLFALRMVTDEGYQLEAAKNYMIEFLENTYARRYEKMSQTAEVEEEIQLAEKKAVLVEGPTETEKDSIAALQPEAESQEMEEEAAPAVAASAKVRAGAFAFDREQDTYSREPEHEKIESELVTLMKEEQEKGKDEEEHREKRRRDEQMIREILAEFLT